MEALTVRHLPFATAAGPRQMATDEAMLQAAVQGRASFRLYAWSEPTVSLGYFQPHQVRIQNPALSALPFVRRPTGGLTLVHHHEITYALALPSGCVHQPASWWLVRIHQIIVLVLEEMGVRAQLAEPTPASEIADPLCFRHHTAGDVLIGAAKVVGSAQRRHHGALLQHGAILLGTSPHTTVLPGINDLSGRVLAAETITRLFPDHLSRLLGWKFLPGDFSETEKLMIDRLEIEKYSRREWNEKR